MRAISGSLLVLSALLCGCTASRTPVTAPAPPAAARPLRSTRTPDPGRARTGHVKPAGCVRRRWARGTPRWCVSGPD